MNMGKQQSFISEARRDQIIEATIRTLDEIGYVKASLAQIAKRAGISTALISYHFTDKQDLMNHLLMNLLERTNAYILGQVYRENGTQEKLAAFIQSSLEYQDAHPARNAALVEIIFNARTPDNTPYYKLGDDDENILLDELQKILLSGRNEGVFEDCNIDVVANMIQGAVGEYMFNQALSKKVDVKTYAAELIRIVNKALKA